MESIQMSPKDKAIFVTKENHSTPSKYELPPPLKDTPRGVILPNGDFNWTCPCLGVLPYGPCGFEFQEFFSCVNKEPDEKAQCLPKFTAMKDCFSQFPKLYPFDENEDIAKNKDNEDIAKNKDNEA